MSYSRTKPNYIEAGFGVSQRPEKLARAMQIAFEDLEQDFINLTSLIIGFFGYGERIIDNVLEPKDRDAFYQLEATGMLTTRLEETTLPDGRDWRSHYWYLNVERIESLLAMDLPEPKGTSEEVSVYDDFFDSQQFEAALKRRSGQEEEEKEDYSPYHKQLHMLVEEEERQKNIKPKPRPLPSADRFLSDDWLF
jgi:hypothetical protein